MTTRSRAGERVDVVRDETEDARLAAYAFVPTSLRHDLWRDTNVVDDDDAARAVDDARRTRSALLVSTLLYGDTNQREHKASAAETISFPRTKAERSKRPVKTTPVGQNQAAPSSDQLVGLVDSGDASSRLYSMAVELGTSKRMAFANAVRSLDDYFRGLRMTIDQLNAHAVADAATVPRWMWDPTTKLPTLLQIQRKIVQSVATSLPECDVYLAMYESLPMANPESATPWPLLRYMVASAGSSMAGRILTREPASPEQGEPSPAASFTVLDALDPLLLDDVGDPATASRAVRWLGRVDTHTVMTGPFACLPLVDARGRYGIGILALDACRKATQLQPEAMSPQALFEFLVRMQLQEAAIEFRKLQFGGRQFLQLTSNDLQHRPAYRTLKIQTKHRVMEIAAALRTGIPLHLPGGRRPYFFSDDDEALTMLDDVCEQSGKLMDQYAREVHWHRVMANRTKDVKATALDVYATLILGVSRALPDVERVCLWKIRDCLDIDAIATTHLPDDRLIPFLQWNLRQMRRVPLYMENAEDSGRLIQGNITRVHLPAEVTQANTEWIATKPCERAVYHVVWANRSQQSFSWSQLRLILSIRPMNARHYQLSQLLKTLQNIQANAGGTNAQLVAGAHFQLSDPCAIVILLQDPARPTDVIYTLQIDLLSSSETSKLQDSVDSATVTFVQRAVAISQRNLACVRGRESRSLHWQLSTSKTTRHFGSIGLTPSGEALRALDEIVGFVFAEISTNLPGTQQQVAEMQSDGAHLRYTFAANGSTLLGKTLNRGQGVSFRCIDSRVPLVIDLRSELRNRLKQLGSSERYVEADLPYVFVPLLYEDTCLGVLSVNRFVDVPKGRDDELHPEEGVVEYLLSLAKVLATAIYLKRRAFALHCLQLYRDEPLSSPEQLFFAASRVLQESMIGVWKARFVELDFMRGKTTTVYEYSEAARVQACSVMSRQAIPLGFRANEVLPDTIMNHWMLSREEVLSLLLLGEDRENEPDVGQSASSSTSKAQSELIKRKVWEWRVRKRYYRIELRPLDDDKDISEGREGPSALRTHAAITMRAPNQKYISQALSTSLSSKTFMYSGIEALSIGSSSAVFLAVATHSQFFATCEQSFVDCVAKTVSRMIEALVNRVERSRNRVDALHEISVKCSSFVEKVSLHLHRKTTKMGGFPLTPAEELSVEGLIDLLNDVARFVGAVLDCPNVYIALHDPFHRRLQYVAASPSSGMKGKRLHRGHGVSFHAIDHQQALVVTPDTQTKIEQECGHGAKLRHFSSEPADAQKWPFIVVPVNSVGILALDNLDKLRRLTNEDQPEFGLVDFLRRIAGTVATTVASVRKQTYVHRRQRREEAIVRVMAACEDRSKRSNPLKLQHIVLQAVEAALNGVDAYIGMVQPLCSAILFTSASSRSGMVNQQVNTTDSVSFHVFLSQRTLVIPQVERKQFDASEAQTAQLIRQLRWFTPSQDQGRKGPFVCVPIPFVGVLSVDSFPGGAGGIYSPHVPEHGVVDSLTTMANLLGQSIRDLLALETVRAIPKLFEGNRSTFHLAFAKLLELIAKNVLTAIELSVICYDASSWEPVHSAAAPLATLTSKVEGLRSGSYPTIAELESTIKQSLRANQNDQRCFCLFDHPEIVVLRCLDICDVGSAGRGAIDWKHSCRSMATAIVVRRVRGATWSYDEEFLQTILPVLDELVELVNVRVRGIASRKNATYALEEMCTELETVASSTVAFEDISCFTSIFLNVMIQAASQNPGDAYMGQRLIGGDILQYIAASKTSLMEGIKIEILAPQNQDLVSITCLHRQQHMLVHLLDGKNDRLLRPLTTKSVQRLFAALPMSEERLLCVDSLSEEALDPTNRRLERDVESFLLECASLLEATISNVRYRYAYEQLCGLKSKRHANFREFFATIELVIRRELNVLHSQQIMELADDFTGLFRVRSWHRAATRRQIKGTIPPHFCFTSGCTRDLIAKDIHFDHHIALPMTNVPRALDQSRARMEPAVGREKQGVYACDCLATMLDAGLKTTPKLALCVYSHDNSGDTQSLEQSTTWRSTAFTSRQRQFFFALSAVASEVYKQVFCACVLNTFGIESLFIIRDRLHAKDAVLLAVDRSAPADEKRARVVTGSTVPASKWIPDSEITGRLEERVLEFHHELTTSRATDFKIYVVKQSSTTRTRSTMLQTELITLTPSTAIPSGQGQVDASTKPLFFRRPRIFGGKGKPAQAAANTQLVVPEVIAPPPPRTTELQVLLRGHHEDEVLSLYVEREIFDDCDVGKLIASEIREVLDEIGVTKSTFERNPVGDEEWNGAGFGHAPEIGEGNESGGGGFHVLSSWTHWRDALRDIIVHFDTDMRGYLTGVQATSREQLGPVASNIRHGLLPSDHPPTTRVSIFAHDNLSLRSAAVVLVRAALVFCGYKKEVVIDSPPNKDDDLLKEYLRISAGRKLLDFNPRVTAKWGVALRAANYVRTKYAHVSRLDIQSESSAVQAARTLSVFISAFTSAVKYFKFLQERAKQRKLNVDLIATRIQCFYRIVLARKLLRQLKSEYSAAVVIQCAFRQHLARRKRVFLKWNRAAIIVQKAYRRKLAQRRGRRPRKLTVELRTVAAQYGTMQVGRTGTSLGAVDEGGDAWKVEMASFDSFRAYLQSRAGREHLKREEHVIAERLKEVARHREETLTTHDRLLADVHDIFELLDVDGTGELSRERTQELIKRLHIPLSGEEAADVIDMMDNDRSGAISFSEFTSWFSHELDVLKRRSRECGVLSKRDRQWIAEESARSALRKRWRAHQASSSLHAQDPISVSTRANAVEIAEEEAADNSSQANES